MNQYTLLGMAVEYKNLLEEVSEVIKFVSEYSDTARSLELTIRTGNYSDPLDIQFAKNIITSTKHSGCEYLDNIYHLKHKLEALSDMDCKHRTKVMKAVDTNESVLRSYIADVDALHHILEDRI